jgi:hypothetical protein
VANDEIIGMQDMHVIYQVTDLFGIDRETISVPLDKNGEGSIVMQKDGILEIIVPVEKAFRDWPTRLREALLDLGYTETEQDDLEEWNS